MISPDFNNVPETLKARDQWVVWRLEHREGKQTKVPYNPLTNQRASSTDPFSWGSFSDAVKAWESGQYSGIGFVFASDRSITGIDLDHVLEGGVLDPQFQELVGSANTYCEVSPSGTGLHIYVLGGKPEGFAGSKKTLQSHASDGSAHVIEVYDQGRYFTITGAVFGEPRDVCVNNVLLHDIKQTYFTSEPQEALSRPRQIIPLELTDNELIQKMFHSKNGNQIRALMEGDTSAHSDDDSSADMALCNHLAFWTGCNKELMDRIFRGSGLVRDKWDEPRGKETYGQMTIRKAIESCDEVYTPARYEGSQNHLDVCGLAENYWIPNTWIIDNRYQLWKEGRDSLELITSTPPIIKEDLRDIDTGLVKAKVALPIKGKVIEFVLDRTDLFNRRKLVDSLSPLGASITDSNATNVLKFMTDFENVNQANKIEGRCVSHLGWAGKNLEAFMPYDKDKGISLCLPKDAEPMLMSFAEARGTCQEWLDMVQPLAASHFALDAALAAGFASVLIGPLRVQPFIVHIWGRSRSGKTPCIMAAASIWADPNPRANAYVRSFADTYSFLELMAEAFHDLPLCIDELQVKHSRKGQIGKRESTEILTYMLTEGIGKGALNQNRTIIPSGSWGCIILTTGEIPLIDESTQTGAMNRVLEIATEPFETEEAAQYLREILHNFYGTAGPVYVQGLQSIGIEQLRTMWSGYEGAYKKWLEGCRQARCICFLAFAKALSIHILSGESWESAQQKSLGLAIWLRTQVEESLRDDELNAIKYIYEYILQHKDNFVEEGTVNANTLKDKDGFHLTENGREYILFFPQAMKRVLNEGSFDLKQTMRRMDAEGLLLTSNGKGHQREKRVKGVEKACYYMIDEDALFGLLFPGESRTLNSTVETGVETNE